MSTSDQLWPDDDGSWPADEPAEPREVTLSVRDVGERIAQILDAGFPEPFWMVGETVELERYARQARSAHWYFKVVDEEDSGRDRPSLSMIMWRSTVSKLFGSRGRLRGRLEPSDGVVMRLKVKPNFYLPRGHVSFIVEDVDPDFTEGSLDRQRRELLERLAHEGALDVNKAAPLPDVPLRIGLVTSDGTAAYEDVMRSLRDSGLGLHVHFCDVRTQGPETGPSVSAALRTLGARGLDAILLVRGGGSRLDLSWFDREDVARAIVACPVPVITGIGHEIDTSVADQVAHSVCKTPTSAAQFVVERGQAALAHVDAVDQRLRELAARALADAEERLLRAGGLLGERTAARLERAGSSLGRAGLRLTHLASAGLDRQAARLERAGDRIDPARLLAHLGGLRERLVADGRRLQPLAARPLAAAHDVLLRAQATLEERARARLERAGAQLDLVEARRNLLDPRAVLARGFAWLERDDGTILKDSADVAEGEAITAHLRDGALDVRTLRRRPPENETP